MEKGRGLPLGGDAAALPDERNIEQQNQQKDGKPDWPFHYFLVASSSR